METKRWVMYGDGTSIQIGPHDEDPILDVIIPRTIIFNRPKLNALYAEARKASAAPVMLSALETVLAYMTNVNAHDPQDVVKTVIEAMKSAGYDEESLDDAAISMLKGIARKD